MENNGNNRREDHFIDIEASSSSSSSENNAASSSNGRSSVYKTVIWIKLGYKMSMIVASSIILILLRYEKPHYLLLAWIIATITAHLVSIPIIFRHYFLPYPRVYRMVDVFYWVLEVIFAICFIVGNYWVLREISFLKDRNLYRWCIALLICDYIKYVGPCLLYVTVLCYRRCALKREAKGGAPVESIIALPTYKFKLQTNALPSKDKTLGVLAPGTLNERPLTGEDVICCICLTNYEDEDELKELPCCHLFHADCVDTWLKIKAFCPLCRCRVGGESSLDEPTLAASHFN